MTAFHLLFASNVTLSQFQTACAQGILYYMYIGTRPEVPKQFVPRNKTKFVVHEGFLLLSGAVESWCRTFKLSVVGIEASTCTGKCNVTAYFS